MAELEARWRAHKVVEVKGLGGEDGTVPLAWLHFVNNEDAEYPRELTLTAAGSEAIEQGVIDVREIIEAARPVLAGPSYEHAIHFQG